MSLPLKFGMEIEGIVFDSEVNEDDVPYMGMNDFAGTVERISGFEVVTDGSVRSTRCQRRKLGYLGAYEFRSKARESVDELVRDFRKLKKRFKIKRNKSCGFHVHVSFVDPSEVMCGKFAIDFQEALRKSVTSASKLARWSNPYCKPFEFVEHADFFAADAFSNERDYVEPIRQKYLDKYAELLREGKVSNSLSFSTRYMMTNFKAFRCHKTIEFRAWRTPTSVKELREVLEFVRDFVCRWSFKDESCVVVKQKRMAGILLKNEPLLVH